MDVTKVNKEEFIEIITLKMLDSFLCNKEFSSKIQEIQINNNDNVNIMAGYKIQTEENQCPSELDVISTTGCKMSGVFTRYDAMVLNAVSTLYARGFDSFTPHMVYRVIRGRNDYNTIPAEKLEEVIDSVQKLRQMLVSMDLRKQLAGIKNPDLLQGIYRDANVLQLECFYRADIPNIRVSLDIYWKFMATTAEGTTKEPILRQYARVTNQFLKMPTYLIRAGSEINKNDEVIALRVYLYKNIRWMKCRYRNSKYIKYETIMHDLQIHIANVKRPDKAYKRFYDTVKGILNIFMECGEIQGYEEIYKYKIVNKRNAKLPDSIKIAL